MGIIDLVKINNGESGVEGKKFDIIGIILGVVLPTLSWILIVVFFFTGAAIASSVY